MQVVRLWETASEEVTVEASLKVLSSVVKMSRSVLMFGIDQMKAAGVVFTVCLVSIPTLRQMT